MLGRILVWLSVGFFLIFQGCQSRPISEEAKRLAEEEASRRSSYLNRIMEAEYRAWHAAAPLMEKAADYRANETFGYIGAVFVNELFYPEFLEEAVDASGYGDFVSIRFVFAGSPAEKAGLEPGDKVLSINGRKVSRGRSAAVFALRKIKRILIPGEVNQIEVEREGQQIIFELIADSASYYSMLVVPGAEPLLRADGDALWLAVSLIESVDSTNELAYICAFGLAQNIMRHSKERGQNGLFGQALDLVAAVNGVNLGGLFTNMGQNAYKDGFTIEADLIALFLLASAGYEINEYPYFWEKILVNNSGRDFLKKSEQDRIDKMYKVITAINIRRAAEEPIVPEAYLSGDTSIID